MTHPKFQGNVADLSEKLNAELAKPDVTPLPPADPETAEFLITNALAGGMPVLSDRPSIAERAEFDARASQWFAAMAGLEEDIRLNEAIRDKRIQQERDFCDMQNRSKQSSLDYMTAVAMTWARGYVYQNGKKSRAFSHGSFGKVKQNRKLSVVDEDAARYWAESFLLDAVDYVPKLKRQTLKDWWKARGEKDEIPGCEIVPEKDEPFVKVKP